MKLRGAGFVIQPHFPWIVATPAGLMSGTTNNNDAIRVLRIVCPTSLRNSDTDVIFLSDPNFFIEEN